MFDEIIAMSFQTLNPQSHFLGNVSKVQHRIQRNPRLSAQPFLVLLKTNGSGDFLVSKKSSVSGPAVTTSKTCSLLSEVNTVGVIGGVSSVSTLNFLEKLVRWSSKEGKETIPYIVCSDPVLSRELSVSSLNLGSRKYSAQFDPTTILENLRRKEVFLEQAGAQCIVMPCHVSHAWHYMISKGSSVPFLHIGECVAKELKEANLKPLEAGSSVRIGIIAADTTLQSGFYQEKLHSQGFEIVLPDKATMDHILIPAIEALSKKDMEGARNLFRIALQVLLVRAVNSIILASDEMLGLLPDDDPLLKKCINPMDALVRSTIQWAQTTQKIQNNT